MKKITSIFLIIVLSVFFAVLLSGCSSPDIDEAAIRSVADPITENLLISQNNADFKNFKKDFDEDLSGQYTEDNFTTNIKEIDYEYGKYEPDSKSFETIEIKSPYTIVYYRVNFAKKEDPIVVTTVLSTKEDGSLKLAGFWLK